MIKLLTIDDLKKYLDHLIRVKKTKGIKAINNYYEVDEDELEINVKKYFENNKTYIWGEFIEDKIVSSVNTREFDNEPRVFLRNFKSESNLIYNPKKSTLKLADVVFNFFEKKEIYDHLLIRPSVLFNHRRFSLIEDEYPLNRYNSYCNELIKPNCKSKFNFYNILLKNKTYDIDMMVITMSLKQQYRNYNNEKIHPLNKSKSN